MIGPELPKRDFSLKTDEIIPQILEENSTYLTISEALEKVIEAFAEEKKLQVEVKLVSLKTLLIVELLQISL